MPDAKSPPTALEELIVCPRPQDDNGARTRSPQCDRDWYEDALDARETREKLGAATLSRKDAIFTETLFANLAQPEPLDTTLSMLHAVESDFPTWRIAMRVIAEEIGYGGDKAALIEEARRTWKLGPERHGAALYLLAHVDQADNGAFDWPHFTSELGNPATESDVTAYLDMGRDSMDGTAIIWPSFSPSFARAPLLVTRLDAYADRSGSNVYRVLSGAVRRLCDEHRPAEITTLHTWANRRANDHPSDAHALASAFEDIGPCVKRAAPRPPTPRKRPINDPFHGDPPPHGPIGF
jgi:hypothetical protein